MPITTIDPVAGRFLGGPEAARGIADNSILPRPTIAALAPAEPEPVGVGSAVASALRTSWAVSAIRSLSRPTGAQDGFNPYRFLAEQRLDDPATSPDAGLVRFLVERGQFDGSDSESAFWHDLESGLSYLEDAERLGRAGTLATAAGWAAGLAADPTTAISFGSIGKGAALARIGRGGGSFAAESLATKTLESAFSPASNEPGLADEAIVAATGAGLGVAIGGLSSVIRSGIPGIPTGKMRSIRKGMDDLLRRKPPSEPDRVPGVEDLGGVPAPESAAGSAIAPTSPETISAQTLPDEIAFGARMLNDLLAAEPLDNTVVSVLHRPGDANDALLDRLRARYREAGRTLVVVEHPSQPFYDAVELARESIARADANADATAEDLGGEWIDRAFSAVSSRYAQASTGVTPAGRAARALMARISDAYRTIFGSAQTVARGSARDPLGFEASTPAEAIKDSYEALKDSAVLDLRSGARRAIRVARARGEPIVHDGRVLSTPDEILAAATDRIRHENAARSGFSSDPGAAHPAVAEAAGRIRAYFGRMFDEMEAAGIFTRGRRSLARDQARLEVSRRRLEGFRTRAEKAASAGDEKARLRYERLIQSQEGTVARRLARVRDSERAVEDAKFYYPHLYDAGAIAAERERFVTTLAYQLRRADGIDPATRTEIPIDDRPLHPEAALGLDARDLESAYRSRNPGAADGPVPMDEMLEELREGDLAPAVRGAYDRLLREHHTRTARDVASAILDGSDASPDLARSLRFDERAMADFLISHPEEVMARYHDSTAGRTAMRRAIQLSPAWTGAVDAAGRPIRTGEDLVRHLREISDAVGTVARKSGDRKAIDAADALRRHIDRDFAVPVDLIEGRRGKYQPRERRIVMDAMSYLGRNLLRASLLNKLGGLVWNQLNDFAPLSLYAAQNPRTIRRMASAVRGLSSIAERDLRILNVGLQGITRSRQLFDTDDALMRLGFGTGRTRRLSAAVERGVLWTEEKFARLSLMNLMTGWAQRAAGVALIDRVHTQSRRLLRAGDLVRGGMELDAALRKAGINRYDASRLNKLGLNEDGARRWHELVWAHGQDESGRALRDRFSSFEQYLESDPREIIWPNFDEWLSDPRARDFHDRVVAGLGGEIKRSLVVTPGVGDRPLVNLTWLGRAFNQFQSFAFAFSNQRLRVMAQMPAKYQSWYAMSYMVLGAATDAISNQLSGRRSLSESAELWRTNPLGMVYAAWEKTGLASWWGRPIAVADSLGIPFSPGNLLKSGALSTANRHIQPGRPLTMAGPVFADLDASVRLLGDAASGRWDSRLAYDAAKLAPFQNWFALRLLHQTTGLPVTPESIHPIGRQSGTEPRP